MRHEHLQAEHGESADYLPTLPNVRNPPRARYWDGDNWTEHIAPMPVTAPIEPQHAVSSLSDGRPWIKKKRFLIPGGVLALIIAVAAIGGGGDSPDTTLGASSATTSASPTSTPGPSSNTFGASPAGTSEPDTTSPEETRDEPVEAATDTEPADVEGTVPQENALRSAESYLDMRGFSKKGLVEQLSSEYGEGFSKADAAWAVNQLDVNWNEQAVRAGKSYLEMRGFSRNGLIEQLSSAYGEQFTKKQAIYAADKLGL